MTVLASPYTKAALLEIVEQHPARTVRELAALTGWPLSSLARRMNGLYADGKVTTIARRECRVSGFPANTWRPVR